MNAVAPMMVRSVRADGILHTNVSFGDRVGFDWDTLKGQELLAWIHDDDRAALAAVIEEGEGCCEARHSAADGGWIAVAWSIRTTDGDVVALGTCPGLVGKSSAVAEGGRVASPSLSDTLVAMAHVVEEKNPGFRCSILLVGSDGQHVSVGAGPSLPPEYNAEVEGLRIGATVGSCGTAAYWGVPVVVENIFEDPLWRDLREAAKLAGVHACWSMPIRNTGGEVLGAMALYADEPGQPTEAQMDGLEIAARMVGMAVERDLLEQQLREAEKMKAIGRLAEGVAHNFNNLLTVILGHVDLMREHPDRVPDQSTVDAIARAVESGSDISQRLLKFSRESAGKREDTDIYEALQELTRVFDALLGDEVTVSVETDPSLPWVSIDRGHLGEIMLNLLLNAREAMAGGGHIRVQARRAVQGDLAGVPADLPVDRYVAVSVTDTGCGMGPTVLERAFEPFFTTKEEHGTGLGLATVYALTQQVGGHATIESVPELGTTVTVLFRHVDSAARPAQPKGEVGLGRALVAEDHDEIRNLVVSMLTSAGFSVEEARDGMDAWALCQEVGPFDLVVTDVMMARLGGAELGSRIKELTPETKIVYVSGKPRDQLGLDQLDPGREVFLAKPFSLRALREAALRAVSPASLASVGGFQPGGVSLSARSSSPA